MRIDRAELAGTGAALAFHAALIAALSLSLAHVAHYSEPPPMEVELVDEVGLTPSAPSPLAAPPPPSQAVEQGQDLAPSPPQPEPAPSPQVAPALPPALSPSPPRKIVPAQRSAPLKPAPAAPAKAAPAKPERTIAKPRVSRIGADFLKGIADAVPSASTAPARAAALTISASAMAGIQQAIRRQVQPCADRQVNPGPGASRIKVKLHLVLNRSGRLTSPPQVVGSSGVDDDNSRYEERVKDLAVAAFTGCAPLTGLPQELYQTANGGWSNFNMTYSLP